MGFEIINTLKREKGMTNAQLAKLTGVTLSTIDKITSGVNTNPKLDTLQAICDVLGCSLNDFSTRPQKAKTAPSISDEAMGIAKRYDALDDHGKEMVSLALDCETKRMDAAKVEQKSAAAPESPPTKVIPLFGNSFAAGLGDPDFGNAWEDYKVEADSKADFAIRINGDSMEPYLHDGSIALGVKRAPLDGEVAALLLDGDFICKQVCQDMVGNLYLFALNRKRKDADQKIPHDEERSLTCFGTILMERVALPRD